MKNKIYIEKNRATKVIIYLIVVTIFCSFLLYLRTTYEEINRDSLLFLFLSISMIWLFMLSTVYKNRIEITDRSLYACYYLWYQGFTHDEMDKPLYNTIPWSQVVNARLIQIESTVLKKMISVIVIQVKDRYELSICLDKYTDVNYSHHLMKNH
ncbi:MAG: hypothetical protein KKH92_10615 [Firmicutes bacterium]|nr:hypothetical protein [Bacillota bacterium]